MTLVGRQDLRRGRPRASGSPDALRLAGGASKQGGRDNDRILGDAMEALMAAVYLDGGLASARGVFAAAWTDALASAVAREASGAEDRAAGMGDGGRSAAARPTAMVSRSGPDHAPLFVVEAAVEGYAPERGVGFVAARGREGRRAGAAGARGCDMSAATRAGFAAVIGAPNAGKSTLVNRLVGSKVTIVTQKAQTTRFPVRGRGDGGRGADRAGRHAGHLPPAPPARPRHGARRLGRARRTPTPSSTWSTPRPSSPPRGPAPKAADRRAAEDVRTVIDGLKSAGRQAILALNKIDRVRREDLLALTQRLFESGAYTEVFMISALDGSGVDDLKQRLAELMPEGPWLYPEDQSADLPTQLLAAEITREKLYLRVHEELPYAANVETTAFEERKDGSARIEQTIYVERDSQRADRDRQGRPDPEVDRRSRPQGPGRDPGPPGASLPDRQGAGPTGPRNAPSIATSGWISMCEAPQALSRLATDNTESTERRAHRG